MTSGGTATTDVAPPPAAAPTTVVGVPGFAVGAGPGGGTRVERRAPDQSVTLAVAPFAAAPGRVRIAVADVTGDGVPDLAAGTGPGVTAEVAVYDGRTGQELFRTRPFADFTGGVFVAAGDVDGDGLAEFVLTPDEGGGPRVSVFRGGDYARLADFFGIDDPNFRGGARAAVGDLNGDGFADVVGGGGPGGGPRVYVLSGKPAYTGRSVPFKPVLPNSMASKGFPTRGAKRPAAARGRDR